MDDSVSSEARDRVGSSAPNPAPSTDGPAERLVRAGRPGSLPAPRTWPLTGSVTLEQADGVRRLMGVRDPTLPPPAPLWTLPLAYLALALGRLEELRDEFLIAYRDRRLLDLEELARDQAATGHAFLALSGAEVNVPLEVRRVPPRDAIAGPIEPLPFWKGVLLMGWIGAWLGLIYLQARGLLF